MADEQAPVPFEITEDAAPGLAARYRHWLGPSSEQSSSDELVLRLDSRGLALVEAGHVCLRTDFTAGTLGRRLARASIKREALARACGLKHGHRPRLIDATAGLGRDGLLLACLGCPVTLVERSPVLAALLDDALRRAKGVAWLAPAANRVELVPRDAHDYLAGLEPMQSPDVIYLDPMFEPDRRRGAVGKETALLERLAASAGDGASLLAPARAAARERVVVKRHRHAGPLAGMPPDFRITGRSTRFDAYLTRHEQA